MSRQGGLQSLYRLRREEERTGKLGQGGAATKTERGGEGECRRRGEDGGKGLEVEKGWCQCSSVEAKTSFVDIVVEEVGARGEGNACRGGLNPLGGAAKRVLGVPRFYLG